MTSRSYDGPALDGTVQYLSEAPHWQGDGETVDVVTDEPVGEERAENIPVPNDERRGRCEKTGQTTLDDWGRWSA